MSTGRLGRSLSEAELRLDCPFDGSLDIPPSVGNGGRHGRKSEGFRHRQEVDQRDMDRPTVRSCNVASNSPPTG